jgi:hypothetical protein
LYSYRYDEKTFISHIHLQNKTALHYAIQEHRFETTKLLLQYGADPFLESKYKDDALQTACLKGAAEIFSYLVEHVDYRAERAASGFELLGATFLDEHHDSHKAMQYWRAALDIRDKYDVDKSDVIDDEQENEHYGGATEFKDREELDLVALDQDAMRMQSLLICERVLGVGHKDTIYRLMYRGAAYADSLQYQRCVDLWRYALELRVRKDSILFCDTCFTAQALVKLYLDLFHKQQLQQLQQHVRAEDVLSTVELLARDLPGCARLLRVAPTFKRQQDSYDKVLRIITHLLHLVTKLPSTQEFQVGKSKKVLSVRNTLLYAFGQIFRLCPVHSKQSLKVSAADQIV